MFLSLPYIIYCTINLSTWTINSKCKWMKKTKFFFFFLTNSLTWSLLLQILQRFYRRSIKTVKENRGKKTLRRLIKHENIDRRNFFYSYSLQENFLFSKVKLGKRSIFFSPSKGCKQFKPVDSLNNMSNSSISDVNMTMMTKKLLIWMSKIGS